MFESAKGKQQNEVRQLQCHEQCVDHIPYYLSGLSRAHFSPATFLQIAVYFRNKGQQGSFCSLQTHLITNPSPLALSKAIKNEVEIEGMKQAHVSDIYIYMRYGPSGRLRWLLTCQVLFFFSSCSGPRRSLG